MRKPLLPMKLQFFAEGDASGQGDTNNQQTQQQNQQGSASGAAPAFDYENLAGIIAGKKSYIDKIKKNQLTRALRIDKMTLAALEGTLKYYMDEEQAVKNIPTLHMILSPKEEHKKRAQRLKNRLVKSVHGFDIKLDSDFSMVGGGSMPTEKIETYVLKIKSMDFSAEQLEVKLRNNITPIIVRIYNGEIILDLRTIFDRDFDIIIEAFKNLK